MKKIIILILILVSVLVINYSLPIVYSLINRTDETIEQTYDILDKISGGYN